MIRNFLEFSPAIAPTVYLDDSAQVIGKVTIGEDASVWPNAVIRGDFNYIVIGERTNVQDQVTIHVNTGANTEPENGFSATIGADVTIGHRAILHACSVGDACLIGMGAVVLDGAVIGKESIVGAHSLVTKGKTFPPRSLIMGSPATVVRELTDDEVRALYRSSMEYVVMKNEYISGKSYS